MAFPGVPRPSYSYKRASPSISNSLAAQEFPVPLKIFEDSFLQRLVIGLVLLYIARL